MNIDRDILSRYEQAQKILHGMTTDQLVKNDTIFPNWIENSEYFWYVREIEGNKEICIVNARTASNTIAFDYKTLANELEKATNQTLNPEFLILQNVHMGLSPTRFHFKALEKNWVFEPENALCQEVEILDTLHQQELCSPDGNKAIFLREHNIWIRDQSTGEERSLTQDGIEDYSYARASVFDFIPGLDSSLQAEWSPDSKRVFTIQMDSRKIASRPAINYCPENGDFRPEVEYTKVSYPGDEHVETVRLVIIDVTNGQIIEVDYPPLTSFIYSEAAHGFFTSNLGWWSTSSRHAYFVDLARGSQTVRVVKLDAHSGRTEVLHEETSDTFINLRQCDQEPTLFLPLRESDELIWFSERTGWGHLYLYDLNTGKLKHPITEGQWLVRKTLHFDADQRELLLQTAGRDPEINPYYRDVCKLNIDTGTIEPLASGCFEHVVHRSADPILIAYSISRLATDRARGVSPDGQYIVATRSRVDTVPETILIGRNGKEIAIVECANVSNLPVGWQWPESVKLSGNDNETDIYGVVFRPPSFSPDKSYPVIDFFASYRAFSGLPQGSFANNFVFGYNYFLAAALAAVGFIVVIIEGRGTPLRGKSFQDHNFGDPTSSGDFDDRIAGICELAQRYPYMDLERVGISAIESPNNAIYGLINHSNFYKDAVLHCITDPRFLVVSQGETHECEFDGEMKTKLRYAAENVESFSGKLLLIQGMRSTMSAGPMFQLVYALEKANKDFDMLCIPDMYASISGYTMRREWDYHVKHLQNVETPREFHLTTGLELSNDGYTEEYLKYSGSS
ncbi:S9 family peptidase [SAR92 clade bacterium H455]|uniref:S9 family peptidase n=1 Tax=SAR92 clade bacterium H455 TaxID=2974818 RepID=A0ABY5TNV3_9GAMM|nr:S9 family peptidase [SAR92 clade bacterium H455]